MRDASNPFEPPCPVVFMYMTDEELVADDIRSELNIRRAVERAKGTMEEVENMKPRNCTGF